MMMIANGDIFLPVIKTYKLAVQYVLQQLT